MEVFGQGVAPINCFGTDGREIRLFPHFRIVYQWIRRHNLEDPNLYQHHTSKLKTHYYK
jgi:hypothetical protein